MQRSSSIALSLSFLLVATAAWSWLTGGRVEPDESLSATSPDIDTSRLHDPHREEPVVQRQETLEKSRREVLATAAAPVPTSSSGSRGLVRVHGQVRRGSRPVPNYDLVFQSLGEGPDFGEEDWDFTDEDGRYEVRLPAATYAVLNDDEGPCLTYVVAPKGKDEVVLDIDLPFGW